MPLSTVTALSRLVSRERWGQAFAVTPTTLLAWHRQLVARKAHHRRILTAKH
ncbi:hypothetical protein OG785_03745 [Streptomyces sp. NBC_00006]|uniref:hypothetical protein n=1 Tax=Streptomyces sp. NBC_00006 TaxID=2975619 RepID=UPI00225B1997|nr:hypothetical protein [Streptomyces sp. NBC_00006]MCX5529676.1 hypothetical protein [Streptomyces sp. NBC_00006]